MKTKAQKKGSEFEKHIQSVLLRRGFAARQNLGSGNGINKGDLSTSCPFQVEAKNQKAIRILEWIDQTKIEAQRGNWDADKWALVFRDPRQPDALMEQAYAVIELEEFIKLMKKDAEPLSKAPDKDLAYQLHQIATLAKRVSCGDGKTDTYLYRSLAKFCDLAVKKLER